MGIRRSDPVLLIARRAAAVAACLVLASCASSGKFASRVDPKYGVSSSPRVVEFGEPEQCCGFGGTFAAKHGEISAPMADDKLAQAAASGRKSQGASVLRLRA